MNDLALRNRDFLLFFVGAFISNLGSWMEGVAMGWTVLQLGNSTFLLGLLGFMQTAPILVLAIPAGTLVDRVDRRLLLLATQSAAAVLAATLTVLQATHRASVPALLAIAGGYGAVNALGGPAWQTFVKDLVGPEQLRQAVALNSARFNLSRIIGPAIGGWLLVAFGAVACFGANTVSFLGVIGALLAIRSVAPPARPRADSGGWRGALEVASHPGIRAILLPAVGLAALAMPYGSFLPVMARDVFRTNEGGLSLLLTAVGAGALGGSFVSGLPQVARRPRRILALLEVVTGLALAAFAWSPTFPLAVACLALFGAAMTSYMATAGATIQLAAVEGTEGRAMALWMIVSAGLMPLGSLLLGILAEVLHIRGALGVAGAGCALAGLVAGGHTLRAWLRSRRVSATGEPAVRLKWPAPGMRS